MSSPLSNNSTDMVLNHPLREPCPHTAPSTPEILRKSVKKCPCPTCDRLRLIYRVNEGIASACDAVDAMFRAADERVANLTRTWRRMDVGIISIGISTSINNNTRISSGGGISGGNGISNGIGSRSCIFSDGGRVRGYPDVSIDTIISKALAQDAASSSATTAISTPASASASSTDAAADTDEDTDVDMDVDDASPLPSSSPLTSSPVSKAQLREPPRPLRDLRNDIAAAFKLSAKFCDEYDKIRLHACKLYGSLVVDDPCKAHKTIDAAKDALLQRDGGLSVPYSFDDPTVQKKTEVYWKLRSSRSFLVSKLGRQSTGPATQGEYHIVRALRALKNRWVDLMDDLKEEEEGSCSGSGVEECEGYDDGGMAMGTSGGIVGVHGGEGEEKEKEKDEDTKVFMRVGADLDSVLKLMEGRIEELAKNPLDRMASNEFDSTSSSSEEEEDSLPPDQNAGSDHNDEDDDDDNSVL